MATIALVLAAGFGRRLLPLTEALPKPAVPVANRPMALFSYDVLRSSVTRLAFNTHHLRNALRRALEPHLVDHALELPPLFSEEPTLLGTGGGIRQAGERLEMDDEDLLLVMNGDILFRPDLDRAVNVHRESGALATVMVRRSPDHPAGRAFAVEPAAASSNSPDEVRSAGWDVGWLRRVLGDSRSDAPLGRVPAMFTGVHVLSRRALEQLPNSGCVIADGYARWVAAGEPVAAVFEEAPFRDLGTLVDYLNVNVAYAKGAWQWPGLGPPVHPTAKLTGPVVECVVGARAEVGAKASQSVLWDGVTTRQELRSCVATPTRVVPVRRHC